MSTLSIAQFASRAASSLVKWLAGRAALTYYKLREARSWGLAGGWIMLTRVWLPGLFDRARWRIARLRRRR